MKSFLEFLEEQKVTGKSIHYFDIDDTLSHPPKNLRIHVNNHEGKRVDSLSTQEFNKHSLPDGHSYDFHEFRSSEHFKISPIHPIMNRMKELANKGKRTEILTARSDFDDKNKFAQQWSKHGVDIFKKTHVRRAGNLELKPHEAKTQIISKAIKDKGYKTVHLHDDHKANIDAMLSLKQQHPDVDFHGHHVEHDSDGKVKITRYKA